MQLFVHLNINFIHSFVWATFGFSHWLQFNFHYVIKRLLHDPLLRETLIRALRVNLLSSCTTIVIIHIFRNKLQRNALKFLCRIKLFCVRLCHQRKFSYTNWKWPWRKTLTILNYNLPNYLKNECLKYHDWDIVANNVCVCKHGGLQATTIAFATRLTTDSMFFLCRTQWLLLNKYIIRNLRKPSVGAVMKIETGKKALAKWKIPTLNCEYHRVSISICMVLFQFH